MAHAHASEDMGQLQPKVAENRQREVATHIVRGISPQERAALALYVATLYRIRASQAHPMVKAKDAWAATLSAEVIWPVVRTILQEVKRHAWDERGLKGRAGLASSVAALAMFGSQGAGIAALGGAIGVPLWLVFGAGGAFLAALYEELDGKKPPPTPTKPGGAQGRSLKPTPAADVIDVQTKAIEDKPRRRVALRPKLPKRQTLIGGDTVDCSDCGHSRTITEHWLEELAKQRPQMLAAGRLELADSAVARLKCSSCGSKKLVVLREGLHNSVPIHVA